MGNEISVGTLQYNNAVNRIELDRQKMIDTRYKNAFEEQQKQQSGPIYDHISAAARAEILCARNHKVFEFSYEQIIKDCIEARLDEKRTKIEYNMFVRSIKQSQNEFEHKEIEKLNQIKK